MIQANTPIELIDGLSEHTIRSLNKNQIFFIKDFFQYKDDISTIKKLPGVGDNVIKELENIFGIDGHIEEYLNNLYQKSDNEEDDKLELCPFFVYNGGNYYLNSLCYIVFAGKNTVSRRVRNYFKENHITFFNLICIRDFLSIESIGKGSLKEINEVKYKILDYYGVDNSKKLLKLYELHSSNEIPFKQVDSLNLKDFILNFYNNLSEVEKEIVLKREKWFKDSSFSRRHELGKNNNMSGERIRQFGIFINSDLDFYLKYYSHYFENYIESLLKLHDDFEIRKFSEIEEFSQFSYEFIGNTLSKIISSNYLFHKNDLSNTFFFLKKSRIGGIKNCKFFDTIDRLFNKERKIEKTETLYNITKLGIGKDVDREIVIETKPIVKLYLEYVFNLKEDNEKILLPINKKDYPSLIINELILCNKRIHFSKLYNKLKIKYPQYPWSKSTVHHVLQGHSDAVNVGPGLYIHKSKKPNSQGFKTIVEVIENFLNESKVKCATVDDIIKYVKKQKSVSENSIKVYLMSNEKFINIGNGIYGLKTIREGKLILNKPKSIADIIEEFLGKTEDKCANFDDIVSYVKSQRTASEKTIISVLCYGKRNKNRFVRIGTGIYGLTSYREGKILGDE